MIRLFTGLAVPSDISTDLSTLRGGLLGARWIEPTDYHVTLQFAGSIEEDIAAELDDELLRLRKSPVDIVLDGIHIFGGAKPRAVSRARTQRSNLPCNSLRECSRWASHIRAR